MTARVLIIAGSDPSGGAGVQADIKTVTALGGYAAAAITALTVQDTVGVHGVLPVPAEAITAQIKTVLRDIGADCVKIGMIGTKEAADAILTGLAPWPDIPLVLDPVLVATSGDALGDDAVLKLIKTEFLPRARIVTPNAPEAERLTRQTIADTQDFMKACAVLEAWGAKGVMAKAGHLDFDPVPDFYTENGTVHPLSHPRIDTRNTHGTGCTLASAIATGLAQDLCAPEACRRAVAFVAAAIEHAPGLGAGHGPLNHALVERDGRFEPRGSGA